MDVCCECCVLSGRGLCDELITRPEESYRLWYVVVCDLETSWMRRPWPTGGCRAKNKPTYLCSLSDFTLISLHMVEWSWADTVPFLLMYCSFDNVGNADIIWSMLLLLLLLLLLFSFWGVTPVNLIYTYILYESNYKSSQLFLGSEICGQFGVW